MHTQLHTPASHLKGNHPDDKINFKETNSSNNNLSVGKDGAASDKKLNQIYGVSPADNSTDKKNEAHPHVSFAGLGKSQESQAVSSRKVTEEQEPDFLKTAP